MASDPALSVHGGAWDIPAAEREAHRQGCHAAAERAGALLSRGATALEAVVAAVEILEADPTFDSGVGSVLTREGWVEVDAGVMDGRTLRVGCVGAAPAMLHPVRVARLLLDEPEFSFLVGEAATRFGAERGVPRVPAESLIVPRERRRWELLQAERSTVRRAFAGSGDQAPRGTVGAVARDRDGHLAAAVSTGGTPFKPSGRIGDTPVVGCGFLADDTKAAVACTGFGETILRVQLARTTADLVAATGDPEAALRAGLADLSRRASGLGGLIVLGPRGAAAANWNTPTMAYAHWTSGGVLAACP